MKIRKYVIYCPKLNLYVADVIYGIEGNETPNIELAYQWTNIGIATQTAHMYEDAHVGLGAFYVYEIETTIVLGKKVG